MMRMTSNPCSQIPQGARVAFPAWSFDPHDGARLLTDLHVQVLALDASSAYLGGALLYALGHGV